MTPRSRITAHPGEILQEEFLNPLGVTANALATALRVPANRIGAILRGERAVTADTALRLARYFETRPWVFAAQSAIISKNSAFPSAR